MIKGKTDNINLGCKIVTSIDYPFMSIINTISRLSDSVKVEYYDRKEERLYCKFLNVNYHFYMREEEKEKRTTE